MSIRYVRNEFHFRHSMGFAVYFRRSSKVEEGATKQNFIILPKLMSMERDGERPIITISIQYYKCIDIDGGKHDNDNSGNKK